MPIIRRFSNQPTPDTVKNVEPPPKKVAKPAPKLVAKPKPEPRKQVQVKARLPIKHTKAIRIVRRWPRSDEQFVSVENGVVAIRTPKECTNWQHEFRLRVIRDYKAPATLVDKTALAKLYDPETVYLISGRRLMFRQPLEPLDNTSGKCLIIRTEVLDRGDGKAMTLNHPDPAMRILMVYAFVKRLSLDGVASFSVYDWQQP